MIGFTVLSVLLWLTVSVSAGQEDRVILDVIYPPSSVTPVRGSSVKLSCRAHYDFEPCGLLSAGWFNQTAELTDPRKFFTTVSETVSDEGQRIRLVETEILHLTPEDDGEFQCKAECEIGGPIVGHYISIRVQDSQVDDQTE